MDEKTARLAEQLKNNPAMLQSLMQSRDGQMLMQIMQLLQSSLSIYTAMAVSSLSFTRAVGQRAL